MYTLRYHFKCVRKAKDKMRYFDIKKWLWLAGVLYTFLQGYTFYTRREGEAAVGCALLCAICIYQFIRRLCTLYYLHMTMKRIDKLSGRAFERYLTIQFRHLGYRVKLTSYSHDYGADLVLRKWGKKTVVQAKRYERNVGIAAVQEVVGSIAYYKADNAMVVTNSNFTKSARNLAHRNEVELWGRKRDTEKVPYKRMIEKHTTKEFPIILIVKISQREECQEASFSCSHITMSIVGNSFVCLFSFIG